MLNPKCRFYQSVRQNRRDTNGNTGKHLLTHTVYVCIHIYMKIKVFWHETETFGEKLKLAKSITSLLLVYKSFRAYVEGILFKQISHFYN